MIVGCISFNALKKYQRKELICPILSSQLMTQDAFALKVYIKASMDDKQQEAAGLIMPPKLSPMFIKDSLLNMLAYGSLTAATSKTKVNLETNRELAFLVSKNVFLSSPTSYTFSGPQSGKILRAEIIPALMLTTTANKSKKVVMIWSTVLESKSNNNTTEYWMAEPAMDISTFLQTYIHEKKLMVDGCMLHYATDCRFEPDIIRGTASHAGHLIQFTKGIK